MMQDSAVSDHDRLVFGAGFAFGVACLLLVGAVVAVGVGGATGTTSVLGPIVAGVVAALVLGGALFLLAFPENRERVPVDTGLGDDSA